MKLAKYHEMKKESPAPVSRAVAPAWPLRRLRSEMDRLFEDPFGAWLAPDPEDVFTAAWIPAVSVSEGKNHLIVKAELPGMKRDELEVYMSGENLIVSGERKSESEEKTAKTYRSERYFGRFHRSIPLPVPVNAANIEAHYRDGILTITLPKTEEAKRKHVEIRVD